MIKEFFLNKAWQLLAKSNYDLFDNNAQAVELVQSQLLHSIVKENAQTVYGRKHSFKDINKIGQFQKYVPLTSYDDYAPYIEQIKAGEKNVLTKEAITTFELSSGSSGASKHIPYNKALKRAFQSAIKPWIYDLYNRHKGLLWGKSYWSITPVMTEKQYTQSGIPIGFEDDGEYFGKIEKTILQHIFVTPAELKFVVDVDNFRYLTLAFLLKEKNLRLISVWNPSFLLILLDYLPRYKAQIINDFKHGELNLPAPMGAGLKRKFQKQLKTPQKRVKELEALLAGEVAAYDKIWPHLKVISTWAHGNASIYIAKLKQLFKHAIIQPKGLLATECFVSFPFKGEANSVVSYYSHFFEFIPFDNESDQAVKLLHQLEVNRKYSVVVTTGGGFYRYKLLDIIEVVGFYKNIPVIIFVGKESKISDMVGEKLNEIYVKSAVEQCLAGSKIEYSFYLMAPEFNNNQYFYTLYLKYRDIDRCKLDQLKSDLETRLRLNFHYNYARHLTQLGHLKIFLINDSQNAEEIFLNRCNKHGQRLGDIKMAALDNKIGWVNEFKGELL